MLLKVGLHSCLYRFVSNTYRLYLVKLRPLTLNLSTHEAYSILSEAEMTLG